MKVKKVTVVGSGTMGQQIAMQTALCGYETVCYDISREMLDQAAAFADSWFAKRVDKGKLTEGEAAQCRDRLSFSTDLERAAQADLVVEAVSDLLALKRKVLAQLDALTGEDTIYASNSSYIVSSKFADAVKNPGKVLNMHFFNPALVMEVVEVVQGPHVEQDTVDTVMEFVRSIRKTPVLVKKEIYGFVVNRIFSAMTKEACYLLDQGVASVEDIDAAVRGGLGHKMGPLELLDMTGIDLEYNVLMERYRMTGDLADKPSPALVERYAKGEYGRKTHRGFYEYE